jgi:hypothetical protein
MSFAGRHAVVRYIAGTGTGQTVRRIPDTCPHAQGIKIPDQEVTI